jgi:hypothetical protein
MVLLLVIDDDGFDDENAKPYLCQCVEVMTTTKKKMYLIFDLEYYLI